MRPSKHLVKPPLVVFLMMTVCFLIKMYQFRGHLKMVFLFDFNGERQLVYHEQDQRYTKCGTCITFLIFNG